MNNAIQEFCQDFGLQNPTLVQTKSLEHWGEKSMAINAPTGTGKTLAYLLPMVQELKEREAKGDWQAANGPFGLIILPTKELALQVFRVLKDMSHYAKFRARCLITGEKPQPGDIIVTVPGRLTLDLKKYNMGQLAYLVLDEADQLLQSDFAKTIGDFYHKLEWKGLKVRLFSATTPKDFQEVSNQVFKGHPIVFHDLSGGESLRREVDTYNIALHYKEKDQMLELFLKEKAKGSGIVFVNLKEQLTQVVSHLSKLTNIKVYSLSGAHLPQERAETLRQFSSTGGVLVATDVAARGIDIKRLSWVLNYDLPFEPVYYIHRSGRVGRMGRKGLVFNFVTGKDGALIKAINQAISEQQLLELTPLKAIERPTVRPKVATKKAPEPRKKVKVKRTPRYIKR